MGISADAVILTNGHGDYKYVDVGSDQLAANAFILASDRARQECGMSDSLLETGSLHITEYVKALREAVDPYCDWNESPYPPIDMQGILAAHENLLQKSRFGNEAVCNVKCFLEACLKTGCGILL